MKKSFTLTKENFDNLLEWLSADRDEAGVKYEENRQGLIRFFRIRDCADPIALADETLNRIAEKLPKEEAEREKIPLKYIYGFAVNVYREYERTSAKNEIQLDQNHPLLATTSVNENQEKTLGKQLSCLENCLNNLNPEERNLITSYYSKSVSKKSKEMRRMLAENYNTSSGSLKIKTYRIRQFLRNCVKKCLESDD